MFVKAKGRQDPLTGEEAVRFLSDLRTLNRSLVYPEHWVQESATLDDLRGEVPSWARYYAMEDISSAFEGCKVAEGQEHLLTVAPPIPLGPDDFTKEELAS